MSSSSTDPPSSPRQPSATLSDPTSSYKKFLHTTSLTLLFLSPILIALPPRKLDLYTFSLTGAFIASGNHLVKERTGRGLLGQLSRERIQHQQQQQQQRQYHDDLHNDGARILEEPVSAGGSEDEGQSQDWKSERLREEREKLARGEGYGSLIMDQIWEVWNWGDKNVETVKQKDVKVLRDTDGRTRKELEFPRIGKG